MKIPEPISSKLNDAIVFVKNADEKTRYYIFAGVLVFVLILDYLVLMGPQLATMTKTKSQIQIVGDDVTRTKNDLLRLNQYREEVKNLKKQIKQGQMKIRPREGVPLILERISRMATDSSVKVDQISPRAEGQELLLENDERKYYSLPVEITAVSDYHDFGRFLNVIERTDILFIVDSFSIIQGGASKVQSVKVTLKTIVYDER